MCFNNKLNISIIHILKCDCKNVIRIDFGSIFALVSELKFNTMRNIIIFAAALMALSILPVNAKAANLEMDEKKPNNSSKKVRML